MTEHRIPTIDLDKLAADQNGHSVFAPSAAAMWAWCLGSLIPNIMAPDDPSPEAVEGTVAHSMGEQWLKSGERPDSEVGKVVEITEAGQLFKVEITNRMLDQVQEYVDWCDVLPGDRFVEERVYFSSVTPIPNQGGTADHFALSPGLMVITDLKFGKGIMVLAADDESDLRAIIRTRRGVKINGNLQALLYALGVFLKYDWFYNFQTIRIRIAQPRMDNFSVWETTREHLLEFAEWIKGRAHAAWNVDAPRNPHPKACQWCRVKATCTAYLVMQERMLNGDFDSMDNEILDEDMRDVKRRLGSGEFRVLAVDPKSLSTAQMAALAPWRRSVENWWKDLYEELERRAIEGENVRSFKVVEGRTNRMFPNERRAAETLELLGLPADKIYTKSLISPAQADEELRALGYAKEAIPELLKSVVRKPQGRPTMVPETDKRGAIQSIVDDSFEYENDDL